jgi:hypothetical protein
MFGLPLELITMLGSTVLGGVMSIWGQSIKAKQAQNEMLLQRAEFNRGAVDEARNAGKTDKHFAWTRRLIALSAVFAIIVLPKLVAVFYPEVNVIVGYTEVEGGIINWLLGANETVRWQAASGFVITPLDTHIVSAIVGLYFGAGFTK